MAWHLFQIKNAWDSLASTKANMAGLACDTSLEQALFVSLLLLLLQVNFSLEAYIIMNNNKNSTY